MAYAWLVELQVAINPIATNSIPRVPQSRLVQDMQISDGRVRAKLGYDGGVRSLWGMRWLLGYTGL